MNTIIALRLFIISLTIFTLSCTSDNKNRSIAEKYQIREEESTQQMIDRLNYREVSTDKDGFECFASFESDFTVTPVHAYPLGKVREFGIIFPDGRIVELDLEETPYIEGQLFTKDFGTVVIRANYARKVFDISLSYLLAEEQINAIRDKHGNVE